MLLANIFSQPKALTFQSILSLTTHRFQRIGSCSNLHYYYYYYYFRNNVRFHDDTGRWQRVYRKIISYSISFNFRPFISLFSLCETWCLSYTLQLLWGMEPFYRNFVIEQRWNLEVPKTRVGFRVGSKLHPGVGP